MILPLSFKDLFFGQFLPVTEQFIFTHLSNIVNYDTLNAPINKKLIKKRLNTSKVQNSKLLIKSFMIQLHNQNKIQHSEVISIACSL